MAIYNLLSHLQILQRAEEIGCVEELRLPAAIVASQTLLSIFLTHIRRVRIATIEKQAIAESSLCRIS